jgi:hypothetical protein
MDIENKIKDFIDNFYKDADLLELAKFVPVQLENTTPNTDLDYIAICNKIFDLLKNSTLKNKYRIEIEERCTHLIKKLFKTYVKEDTFVITSSHDHQSTTNMLGDSKQYIINLFRLQNKQERIKIFQEIVDAFKESKCKNIFFIMVGTTPQSAVTIDQSFFVELKHLFIKNNIPHLMFLDDCQGIFIIERNYDIFDGFLASGHVLSCLFPDVGLLFTKVPQQIGYINKQALLNLYNKFEIMSKYKDKASTFNSLLTEFFKSENNFEKYKNEAPHQFSLNLRNTINNAKYDTKFIQYGIIFNPINCEDNFVRLRYHEALIQDADTFINGLKELKIHLNKLSRFKEFTNGNKLEFSQPREDHLELEVELNKKIRPILDQNQQNLIQKRFFSSYLQQKTR